jgi:hypothetical protein
VKERGSLSFEEFAAKIELVLQGAPEGMPYGKIRELTGLPQSKPSAYWVKRMEDERGLIRTYDSKTSRFIWRLYAGRKQGLDTSGISHYSATEATTRSNDSTERSETERE